MTESPRITELNYYPVKGCAGISVPRAALTPTGLAGDRSFMLVGPDGVFVSQRRTPRLALIHPKLLDDGARLVLSAPGFDDAELEVRPDGPRQSVSIHGKWFGSGVDQGDASAKWLCTVLDIQCRLVGLTPEHDRKTGFADGQPLHVLSQSSLDRLNERIVARGGKAVPMNRFRPNVVVVGWSAAHTEDRVRRMSLGTGEIRYAKRCVRCSVPLVEQATGKRSGPEPVRTLADYRREPEGGVSFGMTATISRTGEVAVGDPIEVSEWGEGLTD